MRQLFFVLNYNYNGENSQKWDLVITFDWRVLLTQSQRVWTAFWPFVNRAPVKKYDQISFLANFPIVIIM